MEPVTHFLTGACLGRAGLNRKSAYATVAAVLAAEAADLDILWGLAGPVEELKHHRGITHTFWAVPVIAGVVVGVVWMWNRLRSAHDESSDLGGLLEDPSFSRGSLRQPVHWGWLYATACLAALTHILLDWTVNYGVRPFFPFNAKWYAGSFLFIAEPVLWGLFFLAFFMPWILGLADREIGARKQPFRGRGWAIFALAGMTVLGCWRWAEHAQALAMLGNAHIASEPVTRMAAEPYMVNPYRWHAIVETADFYQTAEIDTWAGTIETNPHVLYKPADTPAVEAAKRTLLGQVFLDWGKWAVVSDVGQKPVRGLDPPQLPPDRQWATVEFLDLRFNYSFLGKRTPDNTPLAGWVYIVDGRDEAGEGMDGRVQR